MQKKTGDGDANWFRRRAFPAAVALTVAMAASASVAADTPRDRYTEDSVCQALTSAGIPIANEPADKVAILNKYYAKRAGASGKAIGMTPAQVTADVAGTRSNLARRWAAGTERKQLTKLTMACAALPFFEAMAAFKGRKG